MGQSRNRYLPAAPGAKHMPSNPTPTLSLPLKGREVDMFLPFQGGGQEGDGVSVGVLLDPYENFSIDGETL